jgi:integrase
MQEATHVTPAVPAGPRPSFDDVRKFVAGWVDSRPISEFIAEVIQRYSTLQAAPETAANHREIQRRGKSMSRRTGQSGSLEQSGNWIVVRWWQDVEGQEKRAHKRARVCPIAGPGSLSRSAQERRARDIIIASGADTEEHFAKVVDQTHVVTYREQTELWFHELKTRKRRPMAVGTLENREATSRIWLLPSLGDLPLSEVKNVALKGVIATMSAAGLAPSTIAQSAQIVKMVVGSAVDNEGEEIYPRKWNNRFIDLPRVVTSEQNTPCFSSDIVSALAKWKKPRDRTIFILCAASGLRIGEALGLEIGKQISSDFSMLTIEQQVRNGQLQDRVKTEASIRKVDLHSSIAAMLKEFAGARKDGFLFCSSTGKPLRAPSILTWALHPALKQVGYVNPFTHDHRAGFHAFRRFRNTYLRSFTDCKDGLINYWMGHSDDSMGDRYNKIKENDAYRKEWAERCGMGFDLPPVVPHVPKLDARKKTRKATK